MEACDKDNQGQRWHVDVRALLASAIEELDNEPTEMEVFEEEKSQRAAGERPSPAAAPNRAPDSKAWQQAVPGSEARAQQEAIGGARMPIPVPWLLVLFGSVLLLVAAVCALLLACEGQEAETPQSPRVMILEVDEEEGAGAAPGAGPAAKAAKAEPLAEEAGAAAAEPAAEDVEAAAPPQQPQEEQAAPMTGRKEPEQPAPAAPRSRVPAPEKKKGTKCTVM
uniref:Uncharacterized protein n=2 Tax=Pyrodinium bahamense TaxID=73915 RepID=A0A7S0AXN5_9DINO